MRRSGAALACAFGLVAAPLVAAPGEPLTGALRIYENPEGRTPDIEHRIDGDEDAIDFRSELVIAPDVLALQALGMPPGATDLAAARQAALRDEIRLTLQLAQDYATALAATQRELHALAARRDATQQEWEAAVAASTDVAAAFIDRFDALAEAALNLRVHADADAREQAKNNLTDRAFDGATVSPSRLADVLNDMARELTSPSAEGGPERALRMHAYLHPAAGDEPVPVRIENYFDVADFEGPTRQRLGGALTETQRRQFQAARALNDRALQLIRDWPAQRAALVAGLRAELDGLRGDAEAARRELAALATEVADTDALAERLGAGLSDADRALLQQVRTEREALETRYTSLRQRIEAVRSGLTAADLGTLPVLLAEAKGLAADVKGVKGGGERLADALRAALDMMEARAAEALAAEARRLRAAVAQAVAPLVARFARYELRAGSLRDSLDALLGNERLVANPPLGPQARPVALDDVELGTVRLRRTVADRGDVLRVEVELLEQSAGAGREFVSKGRVGKDFKVERFGWSTDYAPHLAFVDRRGSRAADEPAVNYQPLPIVAYTAHYRPRLAADADGWDRALGVLHPGFGLSAAALDFENKGVQLGVGAQFSVFDDFLFVGYGRNVQAGQDYFYFGFGLTRVLGAFGGEP